LCDVIICIRRTVAAVSRPPPTSPSLSLSLALSVSPVAPMSPYELSLLPSTLSPFHSLDGHLTPAPPSPAYSRCAVVVYIPYLSNYCRGPQAGPVAVIYRMLISG